MESTRQAEIGTSSRDDEEEAQPLTDEELDAWEARCREYPHKIDGWSPDEVLRLILELRRLKSELRFGQLLEKAQRNAAASGLTPEELEREVTLAREEA